MLSILDGSAGEFSGRRVSSTCSAAHETIVSRPDFVQSRYKLTMFYGVCALALFLHVAVFKPLVDWKPSHFGEFIYLTYLHQILQMVYWLVAIVDDRDWFKDHARRRRLKEFRDNFFVGIVFPLAQLVGLVFYTIIRDFKPDWRKLVSTNFAHGAVVVFVWIELLFVPHQYSTKHQWLQAIQSMVVGCIYLAWNIFVRHVDGRWPYPFEAHLSPLGLGLTTLAFAGILLSFYFLGKSITRSVHEAVGAEERDVVDPLLAGTSS